MYSAADSDTAFLTDRYLEHMKTLTSPGWCAHLTYIRPHPPLVAPAPYNSLVDPASLPRPHCAGTTVQEQALHPFIAAAQARFPMDRMVDGFPGLEPTEETVQTLRATYLGLLAEVDHHLGRVMANEAEGGKIVSLFHGRVR